jgi:hypothetical protein
MKGPSDYYQANEEGVDYQRAMEIKAASDAYNKYIQEKYGNEDALKNPKAVERLKQLRSEFNIESNYKFGGDLYQYQNGSQTWDKQKQNLKNEKLEKLKRLLSLPDPVFKAKTFEEKVAEKMEQEKYKTTSKDNTTVRNYNNANKHSNAARNKTNKEFADERQAKIDAQVQANKQPFDWNNFRQSLSDRSQATGDAMRISNEPNFFDDYINPAVMIGSMADNLGQAPLRAQQEDSYMPYVTSVGAPLLTGALAGIGTKNTGQFINNVVNPLAGFGIKKGTVKGEIPKIGDDFANAIHNLDGDKIFYDTTDTSNFLKGEWKYVDELPNEGGISEVEPFNNALDELIVKATYAEKPLLTKKDFFTNKELVDKIAKERSYWDKFFKFSDEYPLSDADMVFDKKFPELKAGSFKEKFMTPEQYNYAKSKLGIFGDLGHQDITNPTIFKKQLDSNWNNAQAFDAQDFQNALRNTIFERTGKIKNANPDYLKSLIKSDEILTPELLNRMGTMENYTGNQAFKTLNANKYGGIINFLQKAQEGTTVTVDQGDGIKKKILTDSREYSDAYNEGRIGVKNDDGSISFNPLNEVVVTPYDKEYPFYQELSDEEKKYFNDDTPIGRAVRRKAYTKNSLSDDVTDIAAPILYGTAAAMLAPYALAPLVAGLEFAGAAAAPYVEGALATSLPGMSSIPGATVGNAINAGFAGHGLYNIAPDAVEMYNNPSWSNAGNVGMDVLEIAPVAGPAGRMIGEGISTVGRMPKQLPGSSTVDYANSIKDVVTTFKNRNKKLLTVGAENLDKELLKKIEQLESPEGFSRLVTQEAEMLKRDFPLLERIIDVEKKAVSNAHTRISELYQTALQGNFNRNYLEAKKLNPGLTPKEFGIPTNNAFFRQGLGSSNYSDNALNLSKEPSLRDNVFSNTYYNAELPGEIAIGREYAEAMPVYDHEINHALQNSRNTTLDDLLRKYFNNSENLSENLSEKTKKAYNYFRKNKVGMPSREPSSFLAEARRSMLERGLIKDIYEPITPKKVFEAMKHFKKEPYINPYTEQSYHRLFDFADDHPKTLKFLSSMFNKLPAAVPVGLAVSAASQAETKKEPVSGMKKGGVTKLSELDKLAIQELGGMLHVNDKLPHEQSIVKYLGPEKSVLNFMKQKKAIGGFVPFNEYYRENIINPRNKS